MSNHDDLEVYVKGNEATRIVLFLNESIGTLVFDSEIDEGHSLYVCGDARVLINEGIQDGYVSVYIKDVASWPSSIDLARDIAKKLKLVVRSDPGVEYKDVSPYSDTFVEISANGESLIEWG